MTVAQIAKKMIEFSKGNISDTDHFMRTWAYAKTIGELENIDSYTQRILEIAAIVHDIACPFCREKYGCTDKKYQEREGAVMASEFLSDSGLTTEEINRISFLVGHHHTTNEIDGDDYRILLEADYIANASEKEWGIEAANTFINEISADKSAEKIILSMFSDTYM